MGLFHQWPTPDRYTCQNQLHEMNKTPLSSNFVKVKSFAKKVEKPFARIAKVLSGSDFDPK
jgi:predicted transcriptional regulator